MDGLSLPSSEDAGLLDILPYAREQKSVRLLYYVRTAVVPASPRGRLFSGRTAVQTFCRSPGMNLAAAASGWMGTRATDRGESYVAQKRRNFILLSCDAHPIKRGTARTRLVFPLGLRWGKTRRLCLRTQ